MRARDAREAGAEAEPADPLLARDGRHSRA
jgi:hypothetical protein